MKHKLKKISDILLSYSETCENQAGDKGHIIWDSDFNKIAKDIVKLSDHGPKSETPVICPNCGGSPVGKLLNSNTKFC